MGSVTSPARKAQMGNIRRAKDYLMDKGVLDAQLVLCYKMQTIYTAEGVGVGKNVRESGAWEWLPRGLTALGQQTAEYGELPRQ